MLLKIINNIVVEDNTEFDKPIPLADISKAIKTLKLPEIESIKLISYSDYEPVSPESCGADYSIIYKSIRIYCRYSDNYHFKYNIYKKTHFKNKREMFRWCLLHEIGHHIDACRVPTLSLEYCFNPRKWEDSANKHAGRLAGMLKWANGGHK